MLLGIFLGWESSVSIATCYRLDSLGIDGGEIFCTCQDQPWGPLSLLYNGYQVLPADKVARAWH